MTNSDDPLNWDVSKILKDETKLESDKILALNIVIDRQKIDFANKKSRLEKRLSVAESAVEEYESMLRAGHKILTRTKEINNDAGNRFAIEDLSDIIIKLAEKRLFTKEDPVYFSRDLDIELE